MTKIVWDTLEERDYFAGVDRGVIYHSSDNSFAAVWNGLVSVTDSPQSELKKYAYDGRTVLTRNVPSEFNGKVEAITYPSILDTLAGAYSGTPGIRVHNLRSSEFHMAYRTKVGNPHDGLDHGYVIHLLYHLRASFDDIQSKTLADTVEPTTFSLSLTATEKYVKNNLPITHLSIDSREVDPGVLAFIEGALYGTDSTPPFIPDPTTLIP